VPHAGAELALVDAARAALRIRRRKIT